ncbi:hypothetical protein GJV76_13455 [Myroides sp. BIT-d1]|uniref:Uncharacterized protein n=1 Tax=Myroides albus TaxID=2562892 RepID=A0A6I3LLA0_9FLAO|nr:hypothetical protein [Myroides albus]MTG99123.1 hypothetical protein [Myroides albus]
MMDNGGLLKLILPKYLVEHFNIIKVEELATRLDIYFEEKNDYAIQCTDKHLVSKGFNSLKHNPQL